MKKRLACVVTTAALFLAGGPCLAADSPTSMTRATADNPAYSVQDRVFFTDGEVNCDELHQSDACELFRQTHPEYNPGYSERDRVAFLDDGVECDELHASDECELYRQENS